MPTARPLASERRTTSALARVRWHLTLPSLPLADATGYWHYFTTIFCHYIVVLLNLTDRPNRRRHPLVPGEHALQGALVAGLLR